MTSMNYFDSDMYSINAVVDFEENGGSLYLRFRERSHAIYPVHVSCSIE